MDEIPCGRGTVLFEGLSADCFLNFVVDLGDRSDSELTDARDEDDLAWDMVGGLSSSDFAPADDTRLSDVVVEVDKRRGGVVRCDELEGKGADTVSGVGAEASLDVRGSGDEGRRSEKGRAALGESGEEVAVLNGFVKVGAGPGRSFSCCCCCCCC